MSHDNEEDVRCKGAEGCFCTVDMLWMRTKAGWLWFFQRPKSVSRTTHNNHHGYQTRHSISAADMAFDWNIHVMYCSTSKDFEKEPNPREHNSSLLACVSGTTSCLFHIQCTTRRETPRGTLNLEKRHLARSHRPKLNFRAPAP